MKANSNGARLIMCICVGNHCCHISTVRYLTTSWHWWW